jgi:hypothetical protein
VSSVPNLADPSVEPTDEELIGLSHRAFADALAARAGLMDRVREQIAEERVRVLARLVASTAAQRKST